MGFNTVVFAESLVKVELLTVDGDLHAAVVKSRHGAAGQRHIG